MELLDILRRDKQEEFWKLYEDLVTDKYKDDQVYATFEAYDVFKKKYHHDLEFTEFWAYLGEEVENPSECPACGDVQVNTIYMGASFQICTNPECRTATGFFSWVPLIFFNGWLFPYTGSYLRGLWDWLTLPFRD